jgi:hypothetical protein
MAKRIERRVRFVRSAIVLVACFSAVVAGIVLAATFIPVIGLLLAATGAAVAVYDGSALAKRLRTAKTVPMHPADHWHDDGEFTYGRWWQRVTDLWQILLLVTVIGLLLLWYLRVQDVL